MTLVVAVSEALGAERHALGDAAGLTPERDKVGGPDEAAHDSVVVLLDILGEVIRTVSSTHQPLAPLHSLIITNITVDGVKQMVKQSLHSLR